MAYVRMVDISIFSNRFDWKKFDFFVCVCIVYRINCVYCIKLWKKCVHLQKLYRSPKNAGLFCLNGCFFQPKKMCQILLYLKNCKVLTLSEWETNFPLDDKKAYQKLNEYKKGKKTMKKKQTGEINLTWTQNLHTNLWAHVNTDIFLKTF